MVTAMCGVHLRYRKRAKDLMLMLGLNETIDWLVVMATRMCRHGHMSRKDSHVFNASEFEVEGQGRKQGRKAHARNRLRNKNMKVGLSKDVFC